MSGHFFPPFSVFAGHFFYFQNKVGHVERGILAFDYVVGLQCLVIFSPHFQSLLGTSEVLFSKQGGSR